MNRNVIAGWLFLSALLSTAFLAYLVWQVSPYQGNSQLNVSAVVLFFIALFLSSSSLFGFVALRIHERWPALAGASGKRPDATVAVRQGLLFGLAISVIALLALLQMLDLIFALVTLLLVGLVEGFIQSKR